MGRATERTLEPSSWCHKLRAAEWLDQNGTGSGPETLRSIRHSLPRNPVDSAALRRRKTGIRNEVTTAVLSVQTDGVGSQATTTSDS
jgi:hypothetical protein